MLRRMSDASDVLVRAIDRDASLRVLAAITTDLARDAAARHHVEGMGACALGRALTSSLLLATLTKGGERVTVQIHGDGPLGGVVVDATGEGEVRGYLLRPDGVTAPCRGRAHVAEALGRKGVINVVRDLGLKERYAGQIPLTTGEIDEDVEGYLRNSEQVPSALGCEVVMSEGGIAVSAGVLVQAMPGSVAGDLLREAQHALRSGELWRLLESGERSPQALARAIYGVERPLEFLEERPLRFQCRCSTERVQGMLRLLSTVELDDMIATQGQAEIICNFCNQRYVVGRERLEAIRAEVAKGPRERN
jgi:molecular chaperone Hsp33